MSLRLCCNDNHLLAHALVVTRLFSYGSIITFKPTVDRFRWTAAQCCGPCQERVVSGVLISVKVIEICCRTKWCVL